MLTLEDIGILGDKPHAEDDDAIHSEASRKTKKKIPKTPLQTWTKSKRILQNKIINAKNSQEGVIEEVFMFHEHLLGKKLCPQWIDITKQLVFQKVGKMRRVTHRRSNGDILG